MNQKDFDKKIQRMIEEQKRAEKKLIRRLLIWMFIFNPVVFVILWNVGVGSGTEWERILYFFMLSVGALVVIIIGHLTRKKNSRKD